MPRPKQPRNVPLARKLRGKPSLPETLLWNHLRLQPDDVKFRRQHPINSYVIDFYCAATRTAFEIEGIVHAMGDHPARDEVRDIVLAALGIEVIRIPARDVLHSPELVAEAIVRHCQRR